MQVKVVNVPAKNGFCVSKFDNKTVVEDMAEKGYRFVGYIPSSVGGYGGIDGLDLVFEKVEENDR